MNVLIAIELIAGVIFVMLFSVLEIARDLSRHSYHPSPDADDDDDGEVEVDASASASKRSIRA